MNDITNITLTNLTTCTNTDDIHKRFAQYRAAWAALTQTNRATIFKALADLEITSITVDFNGEDGCGDINGIWVYRGKTQVTLPPSTIPFLYLENGSTTEKIQERYILEAIDALCFDFLQINHHGWEIEGGAYGEFVFDVAAQTISLEFNDRWVEVTTSEYEL